MIEILALAGNYAASAFAWIKTLPWYVIALAAVVAVAAWEHHEVLAARADLATATKDVATWKATDTVDRQSVTTLKATLAKQNAAVDALGAQGAAMELAAATARAQAAQAAQGRATALAALKAAQGKPIAHDCAAPTAHMTARGQL